MKPLSATILHLFLENTKASTILQIESFAFFNSNILSFTICLILCAACGGMKVTDFLLPLCQGHPIGRPDITKYIT